jgi:O-acetyl-ADP-ribose deacetylase (regulator of RNase III)
MSYTCTVKPGNLLNEKNATFIVNASNTTLLLGSGEYAAFRKKCGMQLQQEMFAKLQSLDQKLQKGDVIATSAGKATNFKYALHAAVMDYNQGINGKDKLPTIDTINLILNNIEPYLQWYSDTKKDETMKLVLPLMGCGVGGLNSKDVLETYKSFFAQESTFDCEVVIYGHSIEDYELARSICLDKTQYTYPLLFEKKHTQ